jgi:predicted RNA-binding protein YlqC (UPF0109 family)
MTERVEAIVEIVRAVVTRMVDRPEDVRVTADEAGEGCILLRVEVHAADRGRVIGVKGSTARALRSVVAVMGRRDRVWYDVVVAGDKGKDEREGWDG